MSRKAIYTSEELKAHKSAYSKARLALRKSNGTQQAYNKSAWERDKRVPEYRMKHLKKYGISLQQYQVMLDAQAGVCYICHKPNDLVNGVQRLLCVDHNHSTGKVRKLLCTKCNRELGFYENRKQEFDKYLDETKD